MPWCMQACAKTLHHIAPSEASSMRAHVEQCMRTQRALQADSSAKRGGCFEVVVQHGLWSTAGRTGRHLRANRSREGLPSAPPTSTCSAACFRGRQTHRTHHHGGALPGLLDTLAASPPPTHRARPEPALPARRPAPRCRRADAQLPPAGGQQAQDDAPEAPPALAAAGARLTSTRSSCLAADSDSMPGSAAAIFLNSACARRGARLGLAREEGGLGGRGSGVGGDPSSRKPAASRSLGR